MSEVVLYTRPGCCLCDDARAVLERVRAELPFELRERDIEADEGLLRAYLERIPVVTLDGEELFELGVDEAVLRESLGRVRAMSETEIAPGSEELGAASERLSLGVAARLSRYLQVLTQARKMGRETISSHELAEYTHVNSTQIRRDLSGFGKFGKRGVGYNVDSLVTQIRKILRTAGQHNIALFGAGHLGTAIASSEIFADHGFRVVAIFDSDTAKVGTPIGQHVVRHNDELRAVVEEQDIVVGVLAVPTVAAQGLADALVDAGVKIIFNYSDALLNVPPEMTVHTSSPAVDLLYALYFYLA
ncbi:MAG TPA: redox-sensing transcriptional repressor Rex [Solirubrobacteraceae bacterium]|jgi:redox-sensing transcriptional repressor|nr:redox-sensing transcriptional repressor Rex [Solirubrobacteraceae bacterium]